MRFQRKKRENVDIALISMIDVLFVLLLFFMVSTSFNQLTEVSIKLPEAQGTAAEERPKTVSLVIDATGNYSLIGDDGSPHQLINQTRAGLKQALTKLAETSKELPFIINADEKAPTKAVITALDIAGQAGFSHVTFPTLQPPEEP
jgi:biopolymer transport protein ExbD